MNLRCLIAHKWTRHVTRRAYQCARCGRIAVPDTWPSRPDLK